MGNQFSQIQFMTQDFCGFHSVQDENFGPIKICKKKSYPFNYLMLIEQRIANYGSNQEIVKTTEAIKKLKELRLVNVAEIYLYRYVENNSFNCSQGDGGRIQLYQQYYTYTLKKYVNSFALSQKNIPQKQIWYVTETLIKSYLTLNQNRIDCSFHSNQIFINLKGEIVLYPNIFGLKDKNKKIQSENWCKSYKSVEDESIYCTFKTKLAKIMIFMIFLEQRYESFVDQAQNYSKIEIQKVTKFIQSCSYSSQLQKLLICLSTEYIVNWKKILETYFQNPIYKKVNSLRVCGTFDQYKFIQIYECKKKNSKMNHFMYHPNQLHIRSRRSNLQKLVENNLKKNNKYELQQETEGNLNTSLNCTTNSIQNIPKNAVHIKIPKISLGSRSFHI